MRTFLSLILGSFLLLSQVAHAASGWRVFTIPFTGTSVAAPVAYCNTDTTCENPPNQCDVLCEDFSGSTACHTSGETVCDSTYTETIVAGDSITWNTSISGTFCAGTSKTYMTDIYYSANGNRTYARVAKTQSVSKGQLYFKFTMASSASNGDMIPIAGHEFLYSGTYYNVFFLQVIHDGTALRGRVRYNNGVGNQYVTGTTKSLSAGTWYRVRWEASKTSRDLDVWYGDQDGSNEEQVANVTDLQNSYDFTHWTFGSGSTSGNGPAFGDGGTRHMYIWGVAIDDDTAPSACTQ